MFTKTIVILVLILAIIFSVKFLFFPGSPQNPTPSVSGGQKTQITTGPTVTAAASPDELLKKIKNLFFETNPDIDFAIGVYDLKNGTYFGYNDQDAQHAASVTKVLTAVYLMREIEAGRVKFNDPLGTYNVEFNLKQMVNQSNTVAWEIIDDFLGLKPQQEFASSIGLTSVNFRDNLMSPKDAAMLFAKLHKGELLEEPYQRKLFSYMQNTETENLITPAIPDQTPFYHKSGLFEGEVHDVAIIDHPQYPFVLSIFTVNELKPDYEGRAALIQKVAAQVYAYFDGVRP